MAPFPLGSLPKSWVGSFVCLTELLMRSAKFYLSKFHVRRGGGRRKSELGRQSGTLDQVSCLKPPFVKSVISFAVGCLFPFGFLVHAVHSKTCKWQALWQMQMLPPQTSFHPSHLGQLPLTMELVSDMEMVAPCGFAISTSFPVIFRDLSVHRMTHPAQGCIMLIRMGILTFREISFLLKP